MARDSPVLLCADQWLFPQKPSILNLRWYIYLYYLPDSATLLAPVDSEAISIATAYANTDANGAFTQVGRTYLTQAVASLGQYVTLVQNDAASGELSQDAATYLVGQANTLISALQKV
ncbi:hypothetical protein [Caballeronia telluris]|uniref:Uncharacterized protein n=1 Tax=Caballeronia telluris TaxID=326475 RepID=A0A158KEF2_9BURK|nr:hypothetical protein [Caballeronia telluris]SAL79444.1 hypothetical protein AWB66_06049 [Caballeronia telluris]